MAGRVTKRRSAPPQEAPLPDLAAPYVPPPPVRPGVRATGSAEGPNGIPNAVTPAGSIALPGTDGTVVVDPTLFTSPIQLGLSGLKRFSGHVYEEFLPQLYGTKAIQTYREMADNDPIIGAILFAIEMLIRQVTWNVETEGADIESQRCRDFIEECLNDMSQPWEETLCEILSMLPYGFSYHELCYKPRKGGQFGTRGFDSQYNDGKIGWRKWAIRAQETRWAWQFTNEGDLEGMWQNSPPDYHNVYIPIQKALLFRPRQHKDNPEGRSILRTAYRSWWFVKRMQEIEGIGVERDLAGFPVVEVPAEITAANATPDQQAVFAAMKQMVTQVRRDQLEGLVLPQQYDPSGKPLFAFKLLSTGGARQFNTTDIITRYETRMAQSVLADFLMLGHVKVGTQALAETKDEMFSRATYTWCKQIASVVNRYAIPRLLALNGMTPAKLPTLEPQRLEAPNFKDLGPFLQSLTAAGMPLFPDPDIENHFREMIDVPALTDAQYQAREAEVESKVRQDQASAVAEYAATRARMNGQPQQVGGGTAAEQAPGTVPAPEPPIQRRPKSQGQPEA